MSAAEAAADGAPEAALEAAADAAADGARRRTPPMTGRVEVPADEQAAKVSAAIAASPASRVSER